MQVGEIEYGSLIFLGKIFLPLLHICEKILVLPLDLSHRMDDLCKLRPDTLRAAGIHPIAYHRQCTSLSFQSVEGMFIISFLSECGIFN